MAYLVIEINSNLSIGDLNSKCQSATKPQEAMEGCRNLFDAILAGAVDATIKVVSKDASTTINTSGSGSESETYNLS